MRLINNIFLPKYDILININSIRIFYKYNKIIKLKKKKRENLIYFNFL